MEKNKLTNQELKQIYFDLIDYAWLIAIRRIRGRGSAKSDPFLNALDRAERFRMEFVDKD